MTYFPRFAIHLSLVIFSVYSYLFVFPRLLLVCLLSVQCLFNISLLLISNKMKSSFLFYGETKHLTSHTDNYRMNDVTMIYKKGLYILI